MTIAICLKVGDGVVLGTDSAASLIGENDRYFNVYNNAEKTINLVKGLPIGLMTYGLGCLAGLSIGSLARDLRQRLSGEDPAHPEWALDPSRYTVEEVAQRVRDFFYDGLYAPEFGNPMAHGPDAAEPGSPDGEWDGEGGAPGAEAPEFPTLGALSLPGSRRIATVRRSGPSPWSPMAGARGRNRGSASANRA